MFRLLATKVRSHSLYGSELGGRSRPTETSAPLGKGVSWVCVGWGM